MAKDATAAAETRPVKKTRIKKTARKARAVRVVDESKAARRKVAAGSGNGVTKLPRRKDAEVVDGKSGVPVAKKKKRRAKARVVKTPAANAAANAPVTDEELRQLQHGKEMDALDLHKYMQLDAEHHTHKAAMKVKQQEIQIAEMQFQNTQREYETAQTKRNAEFRQIMNNLAGHEKAFRAFCEHLSKKYEIAGGAEAFVVNDKGGTIREVVKEGENTIIT